MDNLLGVQDQTGNYNSYDPPTCRDGDTKETRILHED